MRRKCSAPGSVRASGSAMCGWFSLCKPACGREVCLRLIAALPSFVSLRLLLVRHKGPKLLPSAIPLFLLFSASYKSSSDILCIPLCLCNLILRQRETVCRCVLLCAHISQLASQLDLSLASPASPSCVADLHLSCALQTAPNYPRTGLKQTR